MATLHKFKMLATQCAVAGSPTRSPSTSPVITLRRRKTLRMFLTRQFKSNDDFLDRRGSDVDSSSEDDDNFHKDNNNNNNINNNGCSRRKLKDLFVTSSASSSPPVDEIGDGRDEENRSDRWSGYDCDLVVRRGGGSRGVRFFPGSLRQRLLKRAWRPVLVTIPE